MTTTAAPPLFASVGSVCSGRGPTGLRAVSLYWINSPAGARDGNSRPAKIDRSPCGTGCTAGMAVLHARNTRGGSALRRAFQFRVCFHCRIESEADLKGHERLCRRSPDMPGSQVPTNTLRGPATRGRGPPAVGCVMRGRLKLARVVRLRRPPVSNSRYAMHPCGTLNPPRQ
jgi:hypothetical protein